MILFGCKFWRWALVSVSYHWYLDFSTNNTFGCGFWWWALDSVSYYWHTGMVPTILLDKIWRWALGSVSYCWYLELVPIILLDTKFDDGALNIVILLLALRMAPISSVAVNCDGTKCDGAGCWSCWSCQEVLCTVWCLGSRFGVLVVSCGNSRWYHSWKFSGMLLIYLWADVENQDWKGDRWYNINLDSSFPLAQRSILDTETLILQQIW